LTGDDKHRDASEAEIEEEASITQNIDSTWYESATKSLNANDE